jgi:hypothetical protein
MQDLRSGNFLQRANVCRREKDRLEGRSQRVAVYLQVQLISVGCAYSPHEDTAAISVDSPTKLYIRGESPPLPGERFFHLSGTFHDPSWQVTIVKENTIQS